MLRLLEAVAHDPVDQVLTLESVQVLIIHRPNSQRRILNLRQLLAACNAWVPPPGGAARRTRCALHEFRDDAVVEDIAAVRRADVLVWVPCERTSAFSPHLRQF